MKAKLIATNPLLAQKFRDEVVIKIREWIDENFDDFEDEHQFVATMCSECSQLIALFLGREDKRLRDRLHSEINRICGQTVRSHMANDN